MFDSDYSALKKLADMFNIGSGNFSDIINDTMFEAAQQAGLDPDNIYTDGEGQILTAGEGSAVSDKANALHYEIARDILVEEEVRREIFNNAVACTNAEPYEIDTDTIDETLEAIRDHHVVCLTVDDQPGVDDTTCLQLDIDPAEAGDWTFFLVGSMKLAVRK